MSYTGVSFRGPATADAGSSRRPPRPSSPRCPHGPSRAETDTRIVMRQTRPHHNMFMGDRPGPRNTGCAGFRSSQRAGRTRPAPVRIAIPRRNALRSTRKRRALKVRVRQHSSRCQGSITGPPQLPRRHVPGTVHATVPIGLEEMVQPIPLRVAASRLVQRPVCEEGLAWSGMAGFPRCVPGGSGSGPPGPQTANLAESPSSTARG